MLQECSAKLVEYSFKVIGGFNSLSYTQIKQKSSSAKVFFFIAFRLCLSVSKQLSKKTLSMETEGGHFGKYLTDLLKPHINFSLIFYRKRRLDLILFYYHWRYDSNY